MVWLSNKSSQNIDVLVIGTGNGIGEGSGIWRTVYSNSPESSGNNEWLRDRPSKVTIKKNGKVIAFSVQPNNRIDVFDNEAVISIVNPGSTVYFAED